MRWVITSRWLSGYYIPILTIHEPEQGDIGEHDLDKGDDGEHGLVQGDNGDHDHYDHDRGDDGELGPRE